MITFSHIVHLACCKFVFVAVCSAAMPLLQHIMRMWFMANYFLICSMSWRKFWTQIWKQIKLLLLIFDCKKQVLHDVLKFVIQLNLLCCHYHNFYNVTTNKQYKYNEIFLIKGLKTSLIHFAKTHPRHSWRWLHYWSIILHILILTSNGI